MEPTSPATPSYHKPFPHPRATLTTNPFSQTSPTRTNKLLHENFLHLVKPPDPLQHPSTTNLSAPPLSHYNIKPLPSNPLSYKNQQMATWELPPSDGTPRSPATPSYHGRFTPSSLLSDSFSYKNQPSPSRGLPLSSRTPLQHLHSDTPDSRLRHEQ